MFGHLQIKSAYSFQESTILIQSLIDNAKSKHIQALALTDDNNMYGAYEFYEACTKASIKPILGVNASIMFNDDLIHLLLYARDDVGYKDLVRIVSDINLNENKAITLKALSNYRDHLYIVSHEYEDRLIEQEATSKEDLLTHAQTERPVMSFMKTMKSLFGTSYRIMIVEDGIKGHSLRNQTLIKYAQFLDIPCIWGNDVRYLHSHDAFTLDLLQASKKGEVLNKDHEPLTTDRYLKSEKEIREIFGRYPDIIKNTEEIIDNCYGSIQKAENGLPHYKTPTGDSGAYLRHLCIKGLKQRFKNQPITDDYKDRLLYELKIIHTMGYDDYFLIVFDYVQYAKKHGILVGPGRGSAAGSLVAYCLGITNIDPLKYNLLFERFLNPERVSMPDIDVDFQDDRRDEVIQYVCNKYGHDHVAQIVAFSTYGPRVAIKDIGKVMGIPLPRLEMIAKMVPTAPKHRKSITEVYSTSASFQDMIQKDPVLSRLIAPMSLVEYLPRNITMHAAGVVLSYEPLRDVVPLVIGPSDMIMSQYSKDYIEKTGLLKMDFLALKNLTMIDYIMKDIERKLGKTFSINTIPLNDARTYHLISRGDTTGVFQLESSGMRSLLKKMKPECFDDIVAAIALYRPGPMENIPLYLEGRKNKNNITYLLKELEPILKSTYGIMIYQEQIMQIAQVIAGFSLGRADILRKAVSSKDESM
ncbi:DNA polymerase III subunit alpha, partial [Catenibacterium sp.]